MLAATGKLQLQTYSTVSVHSAFVHISNITLYPQGTCNSTTLLTTPLLPRMLHFHQEQQGRYNLQAMVPYIHPFLVIFVRKHTYDNKPQGAYDFTKLTPNNHLTTKDTLLLQVPVSHGLQFATSTSTYHSVLPNTEYVHL